MAIIAGLDGCPSGWLCLIKDLTTGKVTACLLPHIAALLTLAPLPTIAMVDIPIGLTDAGARSCDLLARACLQWPRSSSVFPAPIRPMLVAQTYAQACRIGEAIDGRKLSRQTWGILPKIRQVDAFLCSDPTRQQWVREVHPEVSFGMWNHQPMANGKKSAAGQSQREALVVSTYGSAYAAAKATLPRGQYGHDDLLDAFAALWTAERVVQGSAMILPDVPPVDACGLRMQITV